MSMLEYSEDNAIKEEVLNCDLCPYFTYSVFLIRNHVRRHRLPLKTFNCAESALELYQCKDCNFKTDLIIFLKKHFQEIHRRRSENEDQSKIVEYRIQSFICRNCIFETYSSLLSLKHVKTGCPSTEETPHLEVEGQKIHGENSFKCYHCGYKTNVRHNLIEHIFRRHSPSEKCLNCDKCSFKTFSTSGLTIHKRKYCLALKEMKCYTCIHCPFKAKDKVQLSLHKLQKHKLPNEITWLKCDNCDFKTKTQMLLNRHILFRHTEWKDADLFHCDKCPFKAKRKANLVAHNISKHLASEEIQWLLCDKCPYKAKTKSYLIIHKAHKHKENLPSKNIKVYKCDSCSYKARVVSHLKKHVRYVHTEWEDADLFHCDKCLYKTKSKSSLKVHNMRLHVALEEKQWLHCDKCRYKTTIAKNLRTHVARKHCENNKKLLTCSQCAFQAINKYLLSNHVRFEHEIDHGQDTVLECYHCSYKSDSKSNLQAHIFRNHTARDESFQCSKCDFNTFSKTQLFYHEKYIHDKGLN